MIRQSSTHSNLHLWKVTWIQLQHWQLQTHVPHIMTPTDSCGALAVHFVKEGKESSLQFIKVSLSPMFVYASICQSPKFTNFPKVSSSSSPTTILWCTVFYGQPNWKSFLLYICEYNPFCGCGDVITTSVGVNKWFQMLLWDSLKNMHACTVQVYIVWW